MMKPSDPRQSDDLRLRHSAVFDGSASGRIQKAIMDAVLVERPKPRFSVGSECNQAGDSTLLALDFSSKIILVRSGAVHLGSIPTGGRRQSSQSV
jgi:hypothetical protein